MKKTILTILALSATFFQFLMAENPWEIYNSYKNYTQLEEFHGNLYAVSGHSVFYTDLDFTSTESLTKLKGLSSSDVQLIAKSEETDLLIFVHTDGSIDLMNESNHFSSIYELKNKAIIGNKTINNITVCGDKAYLACGFGFVEIDLRQQLLTNYLFTDSDCNFAFSYANSVYYALTNGGIWKCENGKNWLIEENWQQLDNKTLTDVIVFDLNGEENCWILDTNKDIHILNPDGSYRKNSSRKCYTKLVKSGNYVFSPGWGFDIIRADNQNISYVQKAPYSSCKDFYAFSDSIIYAAHPTQGIVKLNVEFKNRDHAVITPLSEPNDYYEIYGSQINELSYNQGVLAGISGIKMYRGGYTNMYLAQASVNYFEDGQWSNVPESQVNAQELKGKEFRGLTDICYDPFVDHRFYVSTLTTGIYQFDGDSVTQHHFNYNNSRFTAVSCDEDGNLWAGRPFHDTAIWVFDREKALWSHHLIDGFTQVSNIGRIIRQENEPHRLIWALNNYPYQKSKIGILYNPADISDNSKDQSAIITTLQDQDGNLYPLNNIACVYDLHEDLEGKIWLLTSAGPFVVEDPVNTFNNAQKTTGIGLVKRIKVPRNDGTNLADYLMANSHCNAMTTDKLNRKWIGTTGDGVYLISADGLKELKHFTTDNSPLQANDINALAYDEEGKRLFIANEGGVAVYHTDEVEPSDDFSDFYCYPNPLRPDYYGDVEIVGVQIGSQVSVTDSTGNLIWKTQCNDGHTTWNGRNNEGERVAPGVYMIHGISEESKKGKIIKLLVL